MMINLFGSVLISAKQLEVLRRSASLSEVNEHDANKYSKLYSSADKDRVAMMEEIRKLNKDLVQARKNDTHARS